jgi:hypothetical protein
VDLIRDRGALAREASLGVIGNDHRAQLISTDWRLGLRLCGGAEEQIPGRREEFAQRAEWCAAVSLDV